VARVTATKLILDPDFNLDFNTAFVTGPARPHGLAIK
jgi:selenium-binding protein 1